MQKENKASHSVARQSRSATHPGTHDESDMQACIDICLDCYGTCASTVVYCLQMGGRHAGAAHIALMLDCADICQTSANFMLRRSSFHPHTCAICAELCEQCAKDCDGFEEARQMKACADMCRKCAQSCQSMAAAVVAA